MPFKHETSIRGVDRGHFPLSRAKREKLSATYIRNFISLAAYRTRTTANIYAKAPVDPHRKLNFHHGPISLLKMEGFMSFGQTRWMQKLLIDNPDISRIVEIGFNAGHSSYTCLRARPDTSVVSFDLGEHAYVSSAKRFIDREFPDRHTLIIGDSREAVPAFSSSNPENHFDLLFIDGGHKHEIAKADIANMRELAADNHIVIVDDYMPLKQYGAGPASAWDEAVRDGIIAQEAIVSADNRTWTVGRYIG